MTGRRWKLMITTSSAACLPAFSLVWYVVFLFSRRFLCVFGAYNPTTSLKTRPVLMQESVPWSVLCPVNARSFGNSSQQSTLSEHWGMNGTQALACRKCLFSLSCKNIRNLEINTFNGTVYLKQTRAGETRPKRILGNPVVHPNTASSGVLEGSVPRPSPPVSHMWSRWKVLVIVHTRWWSLGIWNLETLHTLWHIVCMKTIKEHNLSSFHVWIIRCTKHRIIQTCNNILVMVIRRTWH